MKAIILAAGVGKRLWPVTQHHPKCLIQIGGQTLLARYLESLAGVGIRQAVIVVGYKKDMIQDAVGAGLHGVAVRYLESDQYQRGSITSLWRAREELNGDALIMDADVLFHRMILKRLVDSSHPTALLMDESVKQTGEECMVVAQGGRVIALTKKMPSRYDMAGEGVGFLKVRGADTGSLIRSVQAYVERGQLDMEYEDALLEFFGEVKVGYERIGGLPWTEIDFEDDIVKAEREILPKLG
jgi:L-glutamine-phosphate cytidylyltransferase